MSGFIPEQWRELEERMWEIADEARPAQTIINASRSFSVGDGFRLGYGFTSGVAAVFIIGMCVARVLHWIGLA